MQNSVNHRIFERTLRSMAIRRACLFECHEISHPKRFLNETAWRMGSGWVPLPALPSTGSPEMHERLETLCIRLSCGRRRPSSVFLQAWHDTSFAMSPNGGMFGCVCVCFELCLCANPLSLLVSNQVGSPAELKHINKRRKRN